LFVQLRSTCTCRMGSPTLRGRSTARAVNIGVTMEMTAPRTTAWGVASCRTSYWRSRRIRSSGRRLRPRN
jgi:hypothetical protein